MMNKALVDKIWAFDERRNLALPGDEKAALSFAVERWLQAAERSIDTKGLFNCALSGGSTPKAIYQALAKEKRTLDWSKVFLYFSDERCVPQTSPESNFHSAWNAGFKELVSPEQIFPMFESGDPQEAAQKYDALVASCEMDLIMLGVGEDGHTASLFPYTHALHCDDREVAANFLPEKGVWRLTMTFKKINQSPCTNLYVFGKAKTSIVKEIFTSPYEPDRLPSQKIGTPENKALWILDDLSAASLYQMPS